MPSQFVGVLKEISGSLTASGIRFRRVQGRGAPTVFDATGWVLNVGDKVHVGRFGGPGPDQLVVSSASGEYLGLVGADLAATDIGVRTFSIRQGSVPFANGASGWILNPGDRFHPVDLDGDDRDELAVSSANGSHLGALRSEADQLFAVAIAHDMVPFGDGSAGWVLNQGDRFYRLDAEVSERDVLAVSSFNGKYLGVLSYDDVFYTRSIHHGVVPFAGSSSGWVLNQGDQFYPADLDGDGRDELVVSSSNGQYLGVLARDGNDLAALAIRHGSVPFADGSSGWILNQGDRFHPADLDGLGGDELAVSSADGDYLGVLALENGNLVTRSIRHGAVPFADGSSGWVLNHGDRFRPADLDGVGGEELAVLSSNGEYLGVLALSGADLITRSIRHGWVPFINGASGWILNQGDQLYSADLDGDGRSELLMLSPEGEHSYIKLHIRVLTPPGTPGASINEQVRQLARLVLPRDIHIEVASRAVLNLPASQTPSVGPCLLGEPSLDLMTLHVNRQGMGYNEIGVFFVLATQPALDGCAAHLKGPIGLPSCVVTSTSQVSTLAHEIGHVLGLTHTKGADTVMNGPPDNEPPVPSINILPFSPAQGESMKGHWVMSV